MDKVDDWMVDALCAQVGGDLWFPEGKGSQYTEAKAICARCPVRVRCLEWAVRHGERVGVWGGLTPQERRAS